MAVEIHTLAVTIPSGTTKAGALAFSLPLPPRLVDQVEVQVPPGPRGEVGWALASGGIQMYPIDTGQFVVTDNETVKWPLEQAITSGAWQLLGYNTGQFNHTLYVRFLCRPTSSTDPGAGPAPIDAAALSGG